MRLTTQALLEGVALNLRHDIRPALDDPFAAEAVRLAAELLDFVAGPSDAAVAVRVEEHAAIRALFADAVSLVDDAELAARLRDAAGLRDPGLRIGELDRESARLRGLLVALHARVEAMAGDPARAMDRRIWCLLRDTEARRGG